MRRARCLLLMVLMLLSAVGCAPAEELPIGTATPEDGIAYYLTHQATGMLLSEANGAVGATETPSENVLWLFFGSGDGAYVAQNGATGAYLASDARGGVTAAESRERAIDWRLERMEDGTCRLAAASEQTFLVLADGSAALGGAADRWEMRPLTLRLNVYYDKAFAQSYEEKGICATDALEKILLENSGGAEHWRGLEQFLREELHARMDLHITDTIYQSYPYSAGCLYRDDVSTPCNNCLGVRTDGNSEFDDCKNGYHHKEASRFVKCTPQSDAAYQILFTGHVPSCLCEQGVHGGRHSSGDEAAIFGLAEGIATGNRCAVYLGSVSDILDYEHIRYIAAHELCHLLGASHHAPNEACLHSLTEISTAPEIVEQMRTVLPLCDVCHASIAREKAALLYRHAQ